MMYQYWLLAGAILMFLELVVPGGVVVFLGLAALVVGTLLFYGLIENLMGAMIAWFITSIVLLFGLRSFFMQYFKGDARVDNVDEDSDLVGSVVEVVETIFPYKEGRVRFRDTSWQARCDEELQLGCKARILRRDGNTLVVQAF